MGSGTSDVVKANRAIKQKVTVIKREIDQKIHFKARRLQPECSCSGIVLDSDGSYCDGRLSR